VTALSWSSGRKFAPAVRADPVERFPQPKENAKGVLLGQPVTAIAAHG
jgi:hypothetical protein